MICSCYLYANAISRPGNCPLFLLNPSLNCDVLPVAMFYMLILNCLYVCLFVCLFILLFIIFWWLPQEEALPSQSRSKLVASQSHRSASFSCSTVYCWNRKHNLIKRAFLQWMQQQYQMTDCRLGNKYFCPLFDWTVCHRNIIATIYFYTDFH